MLLLAVALYDSQAVLTDYRVVNFSTSDTRVLKGDQQAGAVPNKTVSAVRQLPFYKEISCYQKCGLYVQYFYSLSMLEFMCLCVLCDFLV